MVAGFALGYPAQAMWRGHLRTGVASGAACAALAFLSACGTSGDAAVDPSQPSSVAPLVGKAERLRERGEYDGAIQAYAAALERTPWNDRIQRALAMTYADRAARFRSEGQLAVAEADLRTALELAPNHPNVQANLAIVLVERASLEMDAERAAARRAEAEELSPGITTDMPAVNAALERRLDLAFELLDRGQLEAGIARLEGLHTSYPDNEEVTTLLVRALTQRGDELSRAGNHVEAARFLDRAVEVYTGIPGCAAPEWSGCTREEVRLAHHNRVVTWLNASQPGDARRALEDAESVGLTFPSLRDALADQPGGQP